MGSKRTKEDDVLKIFTSVFVTNFPKQASAKDLWNACKQYGHVVDAFIPNKRSKAGKRFGFVRFIKVFDVERLVGNLCTVWIGRHRIHANAARFHRPKGSTSSHQPAMKGKIRDSSIGNTKDNGHRDDEMLSSDTLHKRADMVKSLQEVDKLFVQWRRQKAKIKWAIEGDENSKYYHGILNKKRNQLSIRGVLVEGDWVENPNMVKNEEIP
ncbi:nucleotide-binding alpha-beta plait domain-containing protein [Tanacetum coccineum]